ncbi:g5458 [Coccomyxa elongata]
MDSSQIRAAAAAALDLCLVIGRAAGKTTVQTTIGFFDVTPVTIYGQALTYRISFPRPTSSPTPPTTGVHLHRDASCRGLYKEVNVVYSGESTNGVTFTPTSSGGQGLPDVTTQVLPASVQFFSSFTPFTLANFTAAISVDLTNTNATNKEPAGVACWCGSASVQVISSAVSHVSLSPNRRGGVCSLLQGPTANTLIGNYSLALVKMGANTVKLVLPSSFDAATLFTTTGAYRLIETYYPTPNFSQPQPLVIGFTITRSTPAPPPPPITPGTPPPPPPPPSGPGQKTTIALSVRFPSHSFIPLQTVWKVLPPDLLQLRKEACAAYEEVAAVAAAPGAEISAAAPAAAQSSYGHVEGYGGGNSGSDYGGCSRSGSLTFVAAVYGTNGVPADGTVTFTLAPSKTPLGTVPVVPTAGSAVAKLTVPFIDGATYGYGAQSATAVYSGSRNGAFLPAQVTVSFAIPDCQQINAKEDIVNHVIDTVHEILVSDDTYSGNHGYAPTTPVQVAGK